MSSYEISRQYIEAKYGKFSAERLKALLKDAGDELNQIKQAKDEIFTTYKGIHGRMQHSQLDVLDIREQKICAVFDNVSDMIHKMKDAH